MSRLFIRFAVVAGLSGVAAAQSPVAVPNPMAAHTMFIVLIVGAFLVWAASFSVTTLRERATRSDRKTLQAARDALLDEIAKAWRQRDSGEIDPEPFERMNRRLRGKLASVLVQLKARDADRSRKR